MHFLRVVQLGRLIVFLLANSALTKIDIVLPAAKVALTTERLLGHASRVEEVVILGCEVAFMGSVDVD